MADHEGVADCPSAALTVRFAPDLTAIEVGYQRTVDLTLLRIIELGSSKPIVVHSDAVVELQRGTP